MVIIQVRASCCYSDILVFLTGQEEIESCHQILMKCNNDLPVGMYCLNKLSTLSVCVLLLLDCMKLNVCKLFAALPTAQQQCVFADNPPVSSHTH